MSSFPISLCAFIGLCIASILGATLTADKSALIRSEGGKDTVEMHVSHTGSLISSHDPATVLTKDDGDDIGDDSAKESDMCDVDYPLGKDSCNCGKDDHFLILQEEMCIQAAKEAGVTAPKDSFRIPSEWFQIRPKGCFKFPCSEDPKGICYFFNPIGNDPHGCDNSTGAAVEGTPVCKRAKFLNGTVDGNDGCPVGYQVIMNENNCSEAGICLGFCEGSEFRAAVVNESKHDEYPLGCFIHKTEGCVYYNPPIAGYGPPSRPLGTPICNVSTITHFPPKVG